MNKEFTLWMLDNFKKDESGLFYYKFDFKYQKTKFTYDYLLDSFTQGKTKIIN